MSFPCHKAINHPWSQNLFHQPNITSAWAVDREFFDIYLSLWFPLASFGCLWNAFGAPWADFELRFDSLGSPWVPSGRPLAAFGSLWPAFGLPLALFGEPLGHIGNFTENWTSFTEKCVKFTKLYSKNQLLCICLLVPLVPLVPLKWWHEVLLGPPFHTRRGSGLREFHKLPQINI